MAFEKAAKPVIALRNEPASNELLGGELDSKNNLSSLTLQDSRDFALSILRCGALRARLIAAELDAAGIALRCGMIGPQDAIAWAEEVAPGFVIVVAESIWEGANG